MKRVGKRKRMISKGTNHQRNKKSPKCGVLCVCRISNDCDDDHGDRRGISFSRMLSPTIDACAFPFLQAGGVEKSSRACPVYTLTHEKARVHMTELFLPMREIVAHLWFGSVGAGNREEAVSTCCCSPVYRSSAGYCRIFLVEWNKGPRKAKVTTRCSKKGCFLSSKDHPPYKMYD